MYGHLVKKWGILAPESFYNEMQYPCYSSWRGELKGALCLGLLPVVVKLSLIEAHFGLCAVEIGVHRVACVDVESLHRGSLLGGGQLHAGLSQLYGIEQQYAFLAGIEGLGAAGAQTVDALPGKGVIGVAEGGAGFVEPLLPLLLDVGGVSVVFAAA